MRPGRCTIRRCILADSFSIKGADELVRKLAAAGERALPICAGALHECGEEIMEKSRPQVPWETGTLRNSGRVQPAEIEGSKVTVTLSYGGAAQAYALIQHERTDFNHPRGGKAHYLSDPAKAYPLQSALAAKLRGRLARAFTR
jgi:hypothetical protein